MKVLFKFDFNFLEYKECFSLYDRDGDGLITNDQLKLVLRSLEQCPTQMDINAISSVSGIYPFSFHVIVLIRATVSKGLLLTYT